jgi:WD40 repeat protein
MARFVGAILLTWFAVAVFSSAQPPAPPPAPDRGAVAMKGDFLIVWSLAFRPDGKRLAGGDHHGFVHVWDTATGRELWSSRAQTSWVRGVCFNGDGTLLATATAAPLPIGRPGKLTVWDAETGNAVRTLEDGDAGGVAWSTDGKLLAATATGRRALLKLWDTTTDKVVRTLDDSGLDAPTGVPVAFSPDGKHVGGAARDGEVKIWETATGKVEHTLAGSDARSVDLSPVAFSPDSKMIAAGSLGSLMVWDVATAKKLLVINGAHANGVVSIAFSPDGKRLVSTGNRPHRQAEGEANPPVDDGEVKVWDADKGKELKAFPAHVGGLRAACLSADGKQIAVSPYDSRKAVKVWALERAE